jgi:hypothetical protein
LPFERLENKNIGMNFKRYHSMGWIRSQCILLNLIRNGQAYKSGRALGALGSVGAVKVLLTTLK